jgi:hypothetical protein
MEKFNKLVRKKILPIILSIICTFALQAQISITIDGVGDDAAWATAPAMPINKVIALESGTGITDDNDLSGFFKVLWDANNIYYYLEVKDDTLYRTDATGYLNDNFGVYIDLKNIKCEFYGSDNSDSTITEWEYQWQNDVWGGRTATGTGGEWGGNWAPLYIPDSATQYATIVTPGTGYTMEFKILVTDSIGITLSAGDTIGFDTKIADNDGDGRDQKGWNMGEDLSWHKPTYYGTLLLLADGTVERIDYLPVIDGVAESAWNQTPFVTIGKTIALESTTGIKNDNDLSGKFKLLWDSTDIYYYLEVLDDTLYTTNTTGYLNDNFGVYVDLKNIKCEFYGSDNSDSTITEWEYQWQNDAWGGRTATGTGGEWGGNWAPLYIPDSTQYATVVDSGVGYKIEFKILIADSIGITLHAGDTIGFDTKIADNDGTGRDQKGWYMSSDIAWHKPMYMGTAIAVEGGTFIFSKPLSNIADLKSLTVSEGTLDPAFDPKVTAYIVELPSGSTVVPEITAAAKSSVATVVISETDSLPGKDTITVTAEDAITIKNYIVNFTIISSISSSSIAGLKVGPNPVNDYLDISSNEIIKSVNITNLAGQTVIITNPNTPDLKLNVTSLQSGVYIVKIQTANSVSVQRILKR